MDSTHLHRLLAQLAERPEDEALRAVLGDWLIDQGEAEQAQWLRLESAHRQGALDVAARRQFYELDRRVDGLFRARVVRLSIDACEAQTRAQFSYACPERWTAMAPTADPRVRSCLVCKRAVHFVDSVADGRVHASRGHCVAITPSAPRTPGDLDAPPVPPRLPMPVPGTMPATPMPVPGGLPQPVPPPQAAPPLAPASQRSWWSRLRGK